MRAAPSLDGLPQADQEMLALLYRLHVEASVRKNTVAEIRTTKALESAEKTAKAVSR